MKRALFALVGPALVAGFVFASVVGSAHASTAGSPCVGPSATLQTTNWTNGATLVPGREVTGDLHVCSATDGFFAAVVAFVQVGQSQLWNVHSNVTLQHGVDSGIVSTFYARVPAQPGTYQVVAVLKQNLAPTNLATQTLSFRVAG